MKHFVSRKFNTTRVQMHPHGWNDASMRIMVKVKVSMAMKICPQGKSAYARHTHQPRSPGQMRGYERARSNYEIRV